MTSVKTLLEIPELRMRLRTGSALLGREISRIYVTELPDPSRYVSTGELVLSGLLWWREPGDAEDWVSSLARAGVAALAASGADTDGIPDDVVRACAQHRIPLLEVPADLSFAVITERVVLALAADRGREPSGARKRLLSTADAPLPVLLRQGAEELRAACWVLSGTGRVVGGTTPEAPPVEWFMPDRERTIRDEYTLLPVGGRFAIPWILAVRTPETDDLADELAGLVSLARARAEQVRQMADRAAAPLFAALAGGGGDLAAALASSGRTDPVRVVVARTQDGELAPELLAELLAETSASFGAVGEDAYGIVEVDEHWPAHWASIARERLSTVERFVDLSGVSVGLSGPVMVDGLRGAAQEALYAVEVAARRGERSAVVAGEDVAVHRLLIAGAPDELRRSMRERVLGGLLAYDAAQGTDLVRTVRVFLECSSSPTAAAKALHVHVNTLRYRITRASELLGLDLNDFATQVDVYLALRS
ncbi:PucR family transcriptional regulator [Amycolatopsis alkalitolerans]|uniref:PucR family transcriptional regulator n=1 Tax=Amycolatopsis alkalitolerans TaxID=2547244 RepID=A0A5C4LVC9_9PSEU|nr:PucR family transcriptional regulator [Amycolatopsis alkalitolerans]TNC22486.1 PucR family transcriptional regulator [Amycolatopsis alkalitolerans]